MVADTEQKKLKALLKRRHPEYDQYVVHWDFLEACYEGGREWFDDNIFRYMKEGDKEFEDRLERAYRFNHTREVVDLVNKYIFRESIIRNENDAPDSVRAYWKVATLDGQPIDGFMRSVGSKSSIFGKVWVVVDTNNTAEAQTVADQKKMNVQTYAYVVKPQDVLDMSFDDKGGLNWILIRETHRDDKDPLESSGDVNYRYRLWTRTSWTLYEIVQEGRKETVVVVNRGDHNLDEVPVVPVDHQLNGERYCTPALINDIAYLDRAVANYLSNLDAIIQDQTFSQLVIPAQGLMPGEDNYQKMLEMGTKRLFIYNGEGGTAPAYISPDPRQAQLIISVINKIISEIYHTVGMAGERTKQDNAVGIDNSSGVAKAYDFERVNSLLASKADALELAENKINRLVQLWAGETPTDKSLIKYPDNYDVRSLYDEFEVAAQLVLIDAPETVRRQQMEALVDKLFPRLAKVLRDKMIEELKSWPPKPVPGAAGGPTLPRLKTPNAGPAIGQGAVGSPS
jgi:hypothetical protein